MKQKPSFHDDVPTYDLLKEHVHILGNYTVGPHRGYGLSVEFVDTDQTQLMDRTTLFIAITS